ncbi:hypothetical protein IHE45_09G028100 [Dioscorea alata]|uniref:Uncharacterized protein n=1 Tax=Dioscorea alata TaxID=55571 RepID=A0ACB7VDR8_DIOAL|nr:hypothetical protein IHE45_09G028100 [Dioscorea alata]
MIASLMSSTIRHQNCFTVGPRHSRRCRVRTRVRVRSTCSEGTLRMAICSSVYLFCFVDVGGLSCISTFSGLIFVFLYSLYHGCEEVYCTFLVLIKVVYPLLKKKF